MKKSGGEAGVRIQTGSKWKATSAVEEAESRLRHKYIVGLVCKGRQGLGCEPATRWKGASTNERCHLVQQEIRKMEEASRYIRSVEMGSQWGMDKWETEQRTLTWNDIWKYTSYQLRFLLRAVYDALPSPTNLCN